MRISDWSSDVCSSDLILLVTPFRSQEMTLAMNDLFSEYTRNYEARRQAEISLEEYLRGCRGDPMMYASAPERLLAAIGEPEIIDTSHDQRRSEEHTSELQSLMRISYAVFCLKKKKN